MKNRDYAVKKLDKIHRKLQRLTDDPEMGSFYREEVSRLNDELFDLKLTLINNF